MNRLAVSLVLGVFCLPALAAKKPELTPAERAATQGYLRVTLPQWEYAGDFTLSSIGGKKLEVVAPELKERHGLASWGGWIAPGGYQLTGILAADGTGALRFAPRHDPKEQQPIERREVKGRG